MIRRATLVLAVVVFAVPAAAHHSYSAYHTHQLITIDGTIEAFEWINPHSLIKVRMPDRLAILEWRAVNGLQRMGLGKDFFKIGDHVVATGNPHREYGENGIVNMKSLCRMSDRWEFPAGACQ